MTRQKPEEKYRPGRDSLRTGGLRAEAVRGTRKLRDVAAAGVQGPQGAACARSARRRTRAGLGASVQPVRPPSIRCGTRSPHLHVGSVTVSPAYFPLPRAPCARVLSPGTGTVAQMSPWLAAPSLARQATSRPAAAAVVLPCALGVTSPRR